jgi:hypothetical protein
MAGKKYIALVNGVRTETASNDTSAGATDAGKIVALNSSGVLDPSIVNSKTTSAGAGDSGKVPALGSGGRLDLSFMPTGVGPDTSLIATSETLAAGDLVNIWDNAGTAEVRKADATTAGKEAHGFVLASFTHPTSAVVYFEGSNDAVTGRTPGKQYLSTTAGGTSATPPSGSGNVIQVVGFATSATNVNFQASDIDVLA